MSISKKELASLLNSHSLDVYSGKVKKFTEKEISDKFLSDFDKFLSDFKEKYPDFKIENDDYEGHMDDEFIVGFQKVAKENGVNLIYECLSNKSSYDVVEVMNYLEQHSGGEFGPAAAAINDMERAGVISRYNLEYVLETYGIPFRTTKDLKVYLRENKPSEICVGETYMIQEGEKRFRFSIEEIDDEGNVRGKDEKGKSYKTHKDKLAKAIKDGNCQKYESIISESISESQVQELIKSKKLDLGDSNSATINETGTVDFLKNKKEIIRFPNIEEFINSYNEGEEVPKRVFSFNESMTKELGIDVYVDKNGIQAGYDDDNMLMESYVDMSDSELTDVAKKIKESLKDSVINEVDFVNLCESHSIVGKHNTEGVNYNLAKMGVIVVGDGLVEYRSQILEMLNDGKVFLSEAKDKKISKRISKKYGSDDSKIKEILRGGGTKEEKAKMIHALTGGFVTDIMRYMDETKIDESVMDELVKSYNINTKEGEKGLKWLLKHYGNIEVRDVKESISDEASDGFMKNKFKMLAKNYGKTLTTADLEELIDCAKNSEDFDGEDISYIKCLKSYFTDLITEDTVHLCTCNNCGGVYVDMNSSGDSKKYPATLISEFGIDELSYEKDGEDMIWACPVCKTDEYLVDDINKNAGGTAGKIAKSINEESDGRSMTIWVAGNDKGKCKDVIKSVCDLMDADCDGDMMGEDTVFGQKIICTDCDTDAVVADMQEPSKMKELGIDGVYHDKEDNHLHILCADDYESSDTSEAVVVYKTENKIGQSESEKIGAVKLIAEKHFGDSIKVSMVSIKGINEDGSTEFVVDLEGDKEEIKKKLNDNWTEPVTESADVIRESRTTTWGGVRGGSSRPIITFSKKDYDVNVSKKTMEVDVNIKKSDTVNQQALNDTDAKWEQHHWGYMVYPKSVDQLCAVLKALKINCKKEEIKSHLKPESTDESMASFVPKDINTMASTIQAMNMTVDSGQSQDFKKIMDEFQKKYDSKGEMSISDVIKKAGMSAATSLYSSLRKFKYDYNDELWKNLEKSIKEEKENEITYDSSSTKPFMFKGKKYNHSQMIEMGFSEKCDELTKNEARNRYVGTPVLLISEGRLVHGVIGDISGDTAQIFSENESIETCSLADVETKNEALAPLVGKGEKYTFKDGKTIAKKYNDFSEKEIMELEEMGYKEMFKGKVFYKQNTSVYKRDGKIFVTVGELQPSTFNDLSSAYSKLKQA